MCDNIEFLFKNICKCKYAAFVGYFLARWVIFDPFLLAPRVHQKGKIVVCKE